MEGDSSHDPISDFLADISIHSLRMEGDNDHCSAISITNHFNPLPPHGGRLLAVVAVPEDSSFQSTPSAWRETHCASLLPSLLLISIHSLRMEGDVSQFCTESVVLVISIHSLRMEGDCHFYHSFLIFYNFNPLPPHGGRPQDARRHQYAYRISIHSLRMEGDTRHALQGRVKLCISIHSLRMEGDFTRCLCFSAVNFISIHSLRMEGDWICKRRQFPGSVFQSTPSAWRETFRLAGKQGLLLHFNPLPPHGGRLLAQLGYLLGMHISIHSLRMEGDVQLQALCVGHFCISIHSLRMEGDFL